MNTIQAAIAEIVAEALRDAANDLWDNDGVCLWLRARADRVEAGLTP